MKPITTLIVALAAATLLPACVSQTEVDELRKVNRTLDEQNLQLRERLRALQDELAALRSGLSADEARELALQTRISELEGQIADLQAALAQSRADLQSLVASTDLSLDPALASQLEALAKANPDLMVWDEARNMIRLRSDLTFPSGSIEVRPGASEALATLAEVFSTPLATPYEIRIVGHTDNVRVRARPGRRFQNNWELSAFRAIAVKNEFTRKGIPNTRISIAGYGEHQPVVANGPRGAAANRRVEVFLVPRAKVEVEAPEEEAAAPAAPGNMGGAGAVEAAPAQTEPVMPDAFK